MTYEALETQNVTVGFREVDKTTAPEFFIQFLDECNELESAKECKQKMLGLLALSKSQTILDVGCGLGHDVREIASLVGPGGMVVGIDHSAVLIAEAIRRNVDLPFSTDFLIADACQLKFADNTFDASRSERVLMHLDQPFEALKEMVRVTKPGGRVVVFDVDWRTLFINTCDQQLTRSIARLMCDQINSGRVGCELPEMFREAGLVDISVRPHTLTAPCSFWRKILDQPLEEARMNGKFNAGELEEWWRGMNEAEGAGKCKGTIQGFIVAGQKH